MAEKSKDELLDVKVGGKPLREWNDSWQPVPGGFKTKHPELRHHIGLARALLNGQTMYILCATEVGEGIEKGLQRIRGRPQTGNAGSGAKKIREHIDELDLEVLLVGNTAQSIEPSKSLKTAMINYYDPEWNRPHRNRMKNIRAGTGN